MLLPSTTWSGAPPTSRASSARNRSGTSLKSASAIRCGAAFSAAACPAISTASRGSGPWCAVFSQIRPSKGPNSAAAAGTSITIARTSSIAP